MGGRVQLGQGTVQATWLLARGRRHLLAVTDGGEPPLLKPRLPLLERLALILALLLSA